MAGRLTNKTVCMLADFSYEDLEIHYPMIRLQEEGAKVIVVGIHPAGTKYTGKYGYPVVSDKTVDDVNSSMFDAIIIPGGWAPDYLRRSKKILQMVIEMHQQGKPVATICHGPWVLCSARIVKDVKVTSFVAIKDDLENAGAQWVDEAVVNDKNIITSRHPKDLVPFTLELINAMLAKK